MSNLSVKPAVKRGRPKKAENTMKEQPKLTYEQKKSLKLKAQKEKEAKKAQAGEPANKDKFYCNNKELTEELIKWRDSAVNPEDRTVSEKFGHMLIILGDKVLNRSEFRNYPKELKEDCRSFFFYKALKGLKNYDFKFNNPFSWLTQCAFNAYLSVLKKHYKHINIKKDVMEKLLLEMQTFPGMNASSSLSKCIKAYIGDEAGESDFGED